MKLRSVLLASAMAVLPLGVVNAQAIDGLYMGGGLGINYLQAEDFQVGGGVGSGSAKSRIGPAGVISLGYGFGNGFRAEVEGDYRQNFGFRTPSGFSYFGGKEQKAGAMVNALYDFVGLVPMVQPYVGVGVGWQRSFEQGLHGAGPLPAVGSPIQFTSPRQHKDSLGYQAILGVAFPIANVPGLAITAEYRFMGLAGNRNYTGSIGAAPVTIKSTDDFNHSALIGFRYAFGVAPLAAAPMPVVDTGAKTFLVFFDWDRADLTARSQGIVRDAATYSTRSQYTRIDVDGNADTSGTHTYNQGLSERRARVVAAELVRDGVPQNAIAMHAYGDTKLLVPTGPNTREPQNRRVEIVFH